MWNIDKSWTLFLDRDGTINRRLPGRYVEDWEQFEFLPTVLEALPLLNSVFGHTVIATNQQGIGKEIMTTEQLFEVHDKMLEEIHLSGGFIHEIYHCPDLEIYNPLCRKPNPGMALKAKNDYPEINFKKSLMVGDSVSDMQFGKTLGMKTAFIKSAENSEEQAKPYTDINISGLLELAEILLNL